MNDMSLKSKLNNADILEKEVMSLRIQLRNAKKLAHAYHLMFLMSDRANLDTIEYHATSSEEDAINDAIANIDKQIDKQRKHISIEDARKLTE